MEWVLVLYVYAGIMAKGDSVALTTVQMESEEACRIAGDAAKGLVSGTTKNTRFICVRNK